MGIQDGKGLASKVLDDVDVTLEVNLWSLNWLVATLRGLPFDLIDIWALADGRWRMVRFSEAEVELQGANDVVLVRPLGVQRCPGFGRELSNLYSILQLSPSPTASWTNDLQMRAGPSDTVTARIVFWHSVRHCSYIWRRI